MGRDGRSQYIERIGGAARRGGAHTIEVRRGPQWLRIHLLGGQPISVETSKPEESLEAALVTAGLVEEDKLAAALSDLRPGEQLRDALIVGAGVDPGALEDTLGAWMTGLLRAPCGQPDAVTEVIERASLPPEVLSRAVPVLVPLLQILWEGVQEHLTLNEVFQQVVDPSRGPVAPAEDAAAWFSQLGLKVPLNRLLDAIGERCAVEQLFTAVPDRSGKLMLLVWFLERSGVLRRPTMEARRASRPAVRMPTRPPVQMPPKPAPLQEPLADGGAEIQAETFSWWSGKSPGDSGAVKVEPEPEAPPASPVSSGSTRVDIEQISTIIRKEHRTRMTRDYYEFLGIPRKAPAKRVALECRRLNRRWTAFGRREDLPDHDLERLKDLLRALQIVFRVLDDPARKLEYDRRVDRGSPPVVGEIRGADAERLERAVAQRSAEGAPQGLEQALRYIERGGWSRAAPILQKLRMDNPADPDVLAYLGWCLHNLGRSEEGDSPEEFLRLAVTFEPEHLPALEFLARMALARGDAENTRRRLRAYLQVKPDAGWARSALDRLPAPSE